MPYKPPRCKPPKPFDQQPTTVAASVPRMEADHLRAIANAQAISMTQLVRKALEQVYGTAVPSKPPAE